ncbi:MAG: hypothetical protein JXQ85_08635 [Cognatishimia sp.]|uniref:hypothetical protein n=1 Tax=Cognatishimia sp. TaxID=2211648 RepID=UPI003B8C5786
MRLAVHLMIAAQLIAWVTYMGVAYLGPDDKLPSQSMESFLFLCVTAIILCFVPALRLARNFNMQPFAIGIAALPIIAVATVVIIQLN